MTVEAKTAATQSDNRTPPFSPSLKDLLERDTGLLADLIDADGVARPVSSGGSVYGRSISGSPGSDRRG